jgi:hypothetical protein
MYRVLSPRPRTVQTDEIAFIHEGKPVYFHKVTTWPELGVAKNMEDAREKFAGRPVLGEWIGETH